MSKPQVGQSIEDKILSIMVPEGWTVCMMATDSGIALVSQDVPNAVQRDYVSMVDVKAERKEEAPTLKELIKLHSGGAA